MTMRENLKNQIEELEENCKKARKLIMDKNMTIFEIQQNKRELFIDSIQYAGASGPDERETALYIELVFEDDVKINKCFTGYKESF